MYLRIHRSRTPSYRLAVLRMGSAQHGFAPRGLGGRLARPQWLRRVGSHTGGDPARRACGQGQDEQQESRPFASVGGSEPRHDRQILEYRGDRGFPGRLRRRKIAAAQGPNFVVVIFQNLSRGAAANTISRRMGKLSEMHIIQPKPENACPRPLSAYVSTYPPNPPKC